MAGHQLGRELGPARGRRRSLRNQFPFELGQRGEDPEHKLPRCSRGVDGGTLPGEDFQSDTSGSEVVNGVDQVVQVAAQPVEFPHDERVPIPERLQARCEPRSVVFVSYPMLFDTARACQM